MSILGGHFGIQLLNYASSRITPYPDVAPAYAGRSKLEALFGPAIWDDFRGRTVIDFGCGVGDEAIEIAQRGAAHVIGLDRKPLWIETAQQKAAAAGMSGRCTFVTDWNEPADVILSLDCFEHFADPEGILRRMCELLRPGGRIRVTFGPPWYHPLGGHIYSVFPFAHLIFTEDALVRWRAQFKNDGATTIVGSGLNKMTVGRFVAMVERSPLRFEDFEAVPIRRLRPFANRLTREFTTAIVRCTLVRR